MIALKSLQPLLNYPGSGYEDPGRLCSTVLNFPKGHRLLESMMSQFIKNYNRDCYPCHGPGLLTGETPKYCQTKDINAVNFKLGSQVSPVSKACNVHNYPVNYFYAVSWRDAGTLLSKNSSLLNSSKFDESFLIHFWGKMSNNVQIGENSVYEFYAKKNCPLMFEKYVKKLYAEFVVDFAVPV